MESAVQIKVLGVCRAYDSCVLCFRAEGARSVEAQFFYDDARLPVPVFPLVEDADDAAPDLAGADSASDILVVEFPLVQAASQRIEFVIDQGTPGERRFVWKTTRRLLQLHSRLNYRLRSELMRKARRAARRRRDGLVVRALGAYGYDREHLVVRVGVFAPDGYPLATLPSAQECLVSGAAEQVVDVRDAVSYRGRQAARVYSYRIDHHLDQLVLSVPSVVEGVEPGFCCVPVTKAHNLHHRFLKRTVDAKLDPRYEQWLERHRASADELAGQRANPPENGPVFSIVVPVYNPPLDYLQECVESVRAQTYVRWQLVLVNASPERADVRTYLDALDDERITVLALEGNRGISGNTNEGIRATTGDFVCFVDQDDFLEPNCLYEYACAVLDCPQAAMLFCDEDIFADDEKRFMAPLLKADWNHDLMLGHNDVIHMLAVSRKALEQVELSSSEVDGAQDYDLTLKVAEVSSDIVHIPRVLYHWRSHSGSSNEGNIEAKPWAAEAGRLSVERHLERLGVPSQVVLTKTPYVYQAMFAVPENNPLISVVVLQDGPGDALADTIALLGLNAGYAHCEVLVAACRGTLQERLAGIGENVQVLDCSDCASKPQALNRAVAAARGQGVLVLDAGVSPATEDFVATLAGYLSRAEVGVVAPLVVDPDSLIRSAGVMVLDSGRLESMNRYQVMAFGGYLYSIESASDVGAVSGLCQFFPRALFDDMGGYDEGYVQSCYDIDFCWRAADAGKLVVYCPYAQAVYAGAAGSAAPCDEVADGSRDLARLRGEHPHRFEGHDSRVNPQCSISTPYFQLI